MYDMHKDLVDAYAAGPDIFEALLADCTEEQARKARGGDENWSVVEVMCHLRDAEERALERNRALRDDPDPQITGYNQEQWAQERNYAAANLRDALAAFVRFRREHVRELAALSPEQWDRPGTHSQYGQVTILDHTVHMVSHDAVHAAQIARQLRGA